jgi:hypothetical protein
VRFGDPIERNGLDDAVLLKQAQAEIEATLDRWRGTTA